MARRQEDTDEDDQRSDSDASEEESESEEDDESEEEEGGEEEEEEDADGVLEEDQAKHNLVEADLSEIKAMIEEMRKIKMRLQFRLAREQAGSSQGSPPRRRSSWEEIVVPVTAAASVQTTWDMPRMYAVEKIVSAHESRLPEVPVPDPQRTEIPVAPSVQLSLQDLARSYGVENAAFHEHGLYRPQPTGDSSKPPQAMEGCPRESVRAPNMMPNVELWDGLVTGGAGSTSNGNDSVGSMDKPPKLHRSQLIPESESSVQSRWPSPADLPPSELRDSFGTPTSPTHAAASIAAANTFSRDVGADGQGKTMEQKELEAMKNLLFF
jgi:hypothetical protein